MLMIISDHFFIHGAFKFPADSITVNRLLSQLFIMGGNLGNDIFVLISGYFLINSKGLKLRKLFNLWLRVFFYSVTIFAIFTAAGLTDFNLKDTVRILMPIARTQWWFASTYFVLYLIHPYVNILLHSFSREQYKKFLMAVFLCWSIFPTFALIYSFENNNLINFICLYSLAGYIKLYADDSGSKKFIWLGFLFIALNFIGICILDIIGFKIPRVEQSAIIYLYDKMRPLMILISLCFFIGFKNLGIQHNKFINTLAAATFGVYLIHDNRFVRPFLWQKVFVNSSFQNSPYLILYFLGVITIVYISCTLIELARMKIFRTLSRGRLS